MLYIVEFNMEMWQQKKNANTLFTFPTRLLQTITKNNYVNGSLALGAIERSDKYEKKK